MPIHVNYPSERDFATLCKALLVDAIIKEHAMKRIPIGIEELHKIYGKRVIILIDEYDSSINSSYIHGYHHDMINFLRGFLCGLNGLF